MLSSPGRSAENVIAGASRCADTLPLLAAASPAPRRSNPTQIGKAPSVIVRALLEKGIGSISKTSDKAELSSPHFLLLLAYFVLALMLASFAARVYRNTLPAVVQEFPAQAAQIVPVGQQRFIIQQPNRELGAIARIEKKTLPAVPRRELALLLFAGLVQRSPQLLSRIYVKKADLRSVRKGKI